VTENRAVASGPNAAPRARRAAGPRPARRWPTAASSLIHGRAAWPPRRRPTAAPRPTRLRPPPPTSADLRRRPPPRRPRRAG